MSMTNSTILSSTFKEELLWLIKWLAMVEHWHWFNGLWGEDPYDPLFILLRKEGLICLAIPSLLIFHFLVKILFYQKLKLLGRRLTHLILTCYCFGLLSLLPILFNFLLLYYLLWPIFNFLKAAMSTVITIKVWNIYILATQSTNEMRYG